MDVVGYAMNMTGLLGLIAGVFVIIMIGSLILGGPPSEERAADGDADQWGDGEADDPGEDGDDDLDVMVATRALLVPDYAGPHLYVELDDGEVVHLFGRWLDDYYVGEPKALFPCERFRPYADSPDPFDFEHPFRVECLGPPLPPLVAEEPLSPDARQAGLAPADWERVPVSFDRLLRRIGQTDAGRLAPRVTPEQIAALESALLQTTPAGDRSSRVETSPTARPAAPPVPDGPGQAENEDATTAAPPFLETGVEEPLFSTSRDADPLPELEPSTSVGDEPVDDAPPGTDEMPDERESGDVPSTSEDG